MVYHFCPIVSLEVYILERIRWLPSLNSVTSQDGSIRSCSPSSDCLSICSIRYVLVDLPLQRSSCHLLCSPLPMTIVTSDGLYELDLFRGISPVLGPAKCFFWCIVDVWCVKSSLALQRSFPERSKSPIMPISPPCIHGNLSPQVNLASFLVRLHSRCFLLPTSLPRLMPALWFPPWL